jgi:hypothetical protein
MSITLRLGLSGPDLSSICTALAGTDLWGSGPPATLLVDDKPRKVKGDWVTTALAAARRDVSAEWEGANGRVWLSVMKERIVQLTRFGFELDPERMLAVLAQVPFTVCSSAGLYPEWTDGSLGEVYQGPGFGELHWPHGWACLFRGAGHDRLVSRRWLDFGPWKLRRGAEDTTLVQFHQLGIDAATALEQARIGHERMGISDTGGFIQNRYVYASDLKGLYYAEQRKLHIVVIGRDVSQREMLDACAARLYQLLGPSRPLDNLVYVFMEEGRAMAHLHELWLRRLECRAIIDGVEADLTANYAPQPAPLEWARHD